MLTDPYRTDTRASNRKDENCVEDNFLCVSEDMITHRKKEDHSMASLIAGQ